MYIPAPTAIPAYEGQNFAPVKPLLSLQTDPKPMPNQVRDALKERLDHYLRLEKNTWKELWNVGQLIDLFCQGKQLVRRNPATGIYQALTPKREDESTMRASNIMKFYESNCITKDMQSNPDILVRAAKFTDPARAAARGGQVIYDHYREKFYQPEYTERDAMLAFRFGTSVTRIRYDPGAQGVIVYQELAQQKTLQIGDGYGYCGSCEYEGTASEFMQQPEMAVDEAPPEMGAPACPQCQSEAVQVIPPASGPVSSVNDVVPVQTGDLVCDLLPLPGCKWDLSHTPENSSWFVYQQSVDMHAIKSILGNIKMPDADDEDLGMKILAALATSGQAVSGRTRYEQGRKDGELYREKRTISEFYMSPSDYGDIEVKGDEQTLGGQPLTAGTLNKTFPDGCVSVWLNNSVLLGLYAENHRRIITSRPWFMRPMSGVGRGAADMVEVQKRLNVTDSQILAYWRSSATPAILYDQDLVQGDEVEYIGNPSTSIAVDTARMAGDNRTIRDSVHQFVPAPIPGGFQQYTYTHLNEMMQLAAHITDFSGGLPGVNNQTATGANILQSNSDAIWTPMLQLKAGARKRQGEIILDLYKKHFPMEREFALGGDYGHAQGIAVSGADLDIDLRLEVAKNSEIPRSPYIKQQNLNNFVLMAGGIEGVMMLKQQFPQLFEEFAQTWDLDFETSAGSAEHVAQICSKRINQLTDALQQNALDPILMITPDQIPMQAGGDPMMMQQMQQQMAQQLQGLQQQAIQSVLMPPISELEPAQHEKALKLQDWLDTDLGQEAPPILRAAVEGLIKIHFQYGGDQQSAMALQAGQVQLAGQGPQMMAGMVSQEMSASQQHERDKEAAPPEKKPAAKKAPAKK